jgi:hypothetical protein
VQQRGTRSKGGWIYVLAEMADTRKGRAKKNVETSIVIETCYERNKWR